MVQSAALPPTARKRASRRHTRHALPPPWGGVTLLVEDDPVGLVVDPRVVDVLALTAAKRTVTVLSPDGRVLRLYVQPIDVDGLILSHALLVPRAHDFDRLVADRLETKVTGAFLGPDPMTVRDELVSAVLTSAADTEAQASRVRALQASLATTPPERKLQAGMAARLALADYRRTLGHRDRCRAVLDAHDVANARGRAESLSSWGASAP